MNKGQDATGIEIVLSHEDVEILTTALHDAQGELHVLEGTVKERLGKYLDREQYELFLEFVRERGTELENVETLQDELEAMQELLQGLPVMRILVPFRAREAFVSELVTLFRSRELGAMRVAVERDSSMLAGAVVEWRGKVYDHSKRVTEEDVATLMGTLRPSI